LEIFEAPERDMAVLSGWGVEKQRDGSNEDAKKRKRKGREQSDDEDDAEDERDDRDDPPPSGSSVSFAPPIRNNSLSERPWSIPPPLPHHFSEPVLPPFRPQLAHSGSIQLTPTSELDVPVLVPQTYYAPMVMPSPMAPPHLPPQPQNQSPSIVTPGSMHNATPTSMINSSPAVETDGASFSAMHMSQREQDEMVEADPEDAEEVLGKDDKRRCIVSNRIISPGGARILVDQ